MSYEFEKFPTTRHLLWLSSVPPRKDKVMRSSEVELFLNESVTVEEKVDGANLGIGFDNGATAVVWNRGTIVTSSKTGQFSRLRSWLEPRQDKLFDVLGNEFILFGEWCAARHSIHYTKLPDYFLAFDVFEIRERNFLSSARRNDIAAQAGLATVPFVAAGHFTVSEVSKLIETSSLYAGPMEGIYLRNENKSWLLARAKVVRAEFVQQIDEHWSKLPFEPNRLELKQ